jgi:hypothetical protein
MSTRKYASGYEQLLKKKKKKKQNKTKKKKNKKKRKVEKLIKSQRGVLNKFVIRNKQNIEDNLSEKFINEQENHQKELEYNDNTIDVSNSIVTNIYDPD